MKLLWLPGWYPVKTNPYNGDFVQRHAQAVSLEEQVRVIYVVRDEKGILTRDVLMEEKVMGNLRETIIYYYSPKYWIRLFDKFLSARIYTRLYRHAIMTYVGREGIPQLIHVHIATKVGEVAIWAAKKWKIPYVVSEQWTAFLYDSRLNFRHWPFYLKRIWKDLMKDAAALSVVSNYLGQSIQKIFPQAKYVVIPNVVNTYVFKPGGSLRKDGTRFIHISGLDHQKNAEDILRAMHILIREGREAELAIIGPRQPALLALTSALGLNDRVRYFSEMPQEELVELIQEADALILYSRYETFGCVVVEAQACGKPVVLSDIPVLHENAEEGFNAVFAQGEQPAALAQKLSWFIENKKAFNDMAIAERAAAQYNYLKVGRQFSELYKQVLSKA